MVTQTAFKVEISTKRWGRLFSCFVFCFPLSRYFSLQYKNACTNVCRLVNFFVFFLLAKEEITSEIALENHNMNTKDWPCLRCSVNFFSTWGQIMKVINVASTQFMDFVISYIEKVLITILASYVLQHIEFSI